MGNARSLATDLPVQPGEVGHSRLAPRRGPREGRGQRQVDQVDELHGPRAVDGPVVAAGRAWLGGPDPFGCTKPFCLFMVGANFASGTVCCLVSGKTPPPIPPHTPGGGNSGHWETHPGRCTAPAGAAAALGAPPTAAPWEEGV